nr:hypothetical protein DSAG12_02159 [Candidatus Prometheoarchaeum syntrophicum]
MGFFLNMVIVFIVGKAIVKLFTMIVFRVRFLRSPLRRILRIGVIFHELSHFVIAKMLFIPVRFSDINFHTKDGGGVVTVFITEEFTKRISFLKDLLIAVAPLWVGNCVIMELYHIFFTTDAIGLQIVSVLFTVIILLVCIPSPSDMKNLVNTIFFKPYVAMKQIIFLVISFLIYNLYFDFFYQFAPMYPYLFEFLMLLVIVGSLEIFFVIFKFVMIKLFSITANKPIGFYKGGSGNVREMFPSRRQRRKNRKMSRSELFTLLPYDDETAAEEFAQAMIENNAMMIDIENAEEEK